MTDWNKRNCKKILSEKRPQKKPKARLSGNIFLDFFIVF